MHIRSGTDRTTRIHPARERERHGGRRRTRPWHSLLLALVLAAATLVATPGTASAADVPSRFVVQGSGYGHGVGMAQYGAYEMSRRGSSATGILGHYYTGTAAARKATKALIDVQVYGPEPYGFSGYADQGATKVVVRGGGWRLRAGERTVAFGPAGTLSVSTSRGDVLVRTPDGELHRHEKLVLHWAGTPYYKKGTSPATVTVAGAHGSYRYGRLLLSASEGVANIVNRLRLNTEYLYGLAEMPASWGSTGGQQALRAQAVVARSYAVTRTGQWKSTCRCHLVDDVRDQQFSGWRHASGPYSTYWRAAVDSTTTALTTGSVLTYAGTTVATHYYSSSGGRTANSEDVWSSAIPYERSVPDPYSKVAPGNSNAVWRRGIGQSKAQDLFGLGQVASIRVADRYSSGQAKRLVATSPSGRTASISGSADRIRALVGSHTIAGSVPSSWFTKIVED
ncbi:SpoIID/LytB domain-containing protein [Promicromonospora iranensis]|uniref:Stage II sporulation protein D n=1 Tax=Promicromonospora iranensis TaxID=1105144 RepID=A0ABU2CSD4_9MICO|nr:SpoIID/LytB domain-containing protein [Promicromonospora iranensis]MDR7384077.1 stage II sporulation protein D [Promicromonospora iranensis]